MTESRTAKRASVGLPPVLAVSESRRLTGPSHVLDGPGAALELTTAGDALDAAVEAWAAEARRALDAVGWERETTAVRRYPGGATVAISAPIDALYAATEVNEWAVEAARKRLAKRDPSEFAHVVPLLRAQIAAEQHPALVQLQQAARSRGVLLLADEHAVSVGSGSGARSWPLHELPHADDVPWSQVYDVPIALVTGSNGKTTTVRLIAAMAAAAGRGAGTATTDGISVAGRTLDEGDWAGPGGARQVLRDSRIDLAVLETARGGILRRGLAVDRARVAVVTNVSRDHMGDYGIHDVPSLAEAKLVTAKAVAAHGDGGRVVLNADDPVLVDAARRRVRAPVVWFSLDPANAFVAAHISNGGEAVVVFEDAVTLVRAGERVPVAAVDTLEFALGGDAPHYVANALAAAAAARALGVPDGALGRALRQFRNSPDDNPGRMNVLEAKGASVVVDFAHNPAAVEALLSAFGSMPAKRRLLVLGQAGDRDDDSIRALGRSAWASRPDRVIVKELPHYLRGREPGVVPRLLAEGLRMAGAPDEAVSFATDEVVAAREALAWAEPGDLLVLLVHESRDAVMAAVREAER